MNEFELALRNAFTQAGDNPLANRAYLEFIKAQLLLPIHKREDDVIQVLFLNEKEGTFLPVFSNEIFFEAWGHAIKDKIKVLNISGLNLLKGVGAGVTIAMNIGSELYKEFNPDEIERIKLMAVKLFK